MNLGSTATLTGLEKVQFSFVSLGALMAVVTLSQRRWLGTATFLCLAVGQAALLISGRRARSKKSPKGQR